MAKVIESIPGSSSSVRVPITKNCIKCGKTYHQGDFFPNRSWKDQLNRDIWCKTCFASCVTKEQMKEYFWVNNRGWDEKMWESAMTKAEKSALNNTTFQKMGPERKQAVLERLACQKIPTLMNTPIYYKYVDNNDIPYHDSKEANSPNEEKEEDPNTRVYSKEFNGYFNKTELEYLESYYQRLEEDFSFDTENLRDYARKVCKASLQADKAQDDFRAGRCDYSVVKDASALFDTLSKSANFAACKRKPGDNGGIGSWSELTYKLETSGHPCTRKIEWEEDDVDRTINEYRYIVEALQLDMI